MKIKSIIVALGAVIIISGSVYAGTSPLCTIKVDVDTSAKNIKTAAGSFTTAVNFSAVNKQTKRSHSPTNSVDVGDASTIGSLPCVDAKGATLIYSLCATPVGLKTSSTINAQASDVCSGGWTGGDVTMPSNGGVAKIVTFPSNFTPPAH